MFLSMLMCIMVGTTSAQRAEAVDLGLSVKWANMNVGADSPEDYGDYFAWGEVKPKRYYGEYSTYKHYDSKSYHKYNYAVDREGSVRDNLLSLQSSDDAASRNMGSNWRMPTEAEMVELLTRCSFTPDTLNGTRGFWVKNRTEQSDSIFMPMAGYRDFGAYRFYPGTQTYYWTSTLVEADSLRNVSSRSVVRTARCMTYSGSAQMTFVDRRRGCVVRAVRR